MITTTPEELLRSAIVKTLKDHDDQPSTVERISHLLGCDGQSALINRICIQLTDSGHVDSHTVQSTGRRYYYIRRPVAERRLSRNCAYDGSPQRIGAIQGRLAAMGEDPCDVFGWTVTRVSPGGYQCLQAVNPEHAMDPFELAECLASSRNWLGT